MSVILDALRKAQEERRKTGSEGSPISIGSSKSPAKRVYMVVAAGIVVLFGIITLSVVYKSKILALLPSRAPKPVVIAKNVEPIREPVKEKPAALPSQNPAPLQSSVGRIERREGGVKQPEDGAVREKRVLKTDPSVKADLERRQRRAEKQEPSHSQEYGDSITVRKSDESAAASMYNRAV